MNGTNHRHHRHVSRNVDAFSPNYKLGRTIGHGSFGEVKIAEHILTGLTVAVKILNRQELEKKDMTEQVITEINILRLLSHPHVIRLYEVIETPTDIYLVMEYADSGELFDCIANLGSIKEDAARYIFQQLISGLEYCHRKLVAHRDLKPENLLLDSKCHIKIADFGLSDVMRDGHFLTRTCGSLNYAAPEILSGQWYAGPEVDIWSCGVILYALLCGVLPFEDENMLILFDKIKAGLYRKPRGNFSDGALDLISRMLMVDPMRRISIPEIRQQPWFQTQLPSYLAAPLSDTASMIDEGIVQQVVNKGFQKGQLLESLHNRTQNNATVTYYLLLDYQLHNTTTSFLEAKVQNTTERIPNHTLEIYMGDERMELSSPTLVNGRWSLGIQSRANPNELMKVVLQALQELPARWKRVGPYNLKCMWVPATSRHQGEAATANQSLGITNSPNAVKFEVQLFKTPDGMHLLDLQRVQGPPLLYLDLCASFLAKLGCFR